MIFQWDKWLITRGRCSTLHIKIHVPVSCFPAVLIWPTAHLGKQEGTRGANLTSDPRLTWILKNCVLQDFYHFSSRPKLLLLKTENWCFLSDSGNLPLGTVTLGLWNESLFHGVLPAVTLNTNAPNAGSEHCSALLCHSGQPYPQSHAWCNPKRFTQKLFDTTTSLGEDMAEPLAEAPFCVRDKLPETLWMSRTYRTHQCVWRGLPGILQPRSCHKD